MVKPDFHLCDVCQAQTEQENAIFVATSDERAPTGELEYNGKYVDLCAKHAVKVLKKILGSGADSDFEMGKKVLKLIGSMKP